MKFIDEIKAVIAGDAREVEIFGENEHEQDEHRPADPAPRQESQGGLPRLEGGPLVMLLSVLVADVQKNGDSEHRREDEPGDTRQLMRKDDPSREQVPV